MIETAENEFLSGDKPFINGAELTLADIHASWMIKWAFHTIGVEKEPGFDKAAFPKAHAWCSPSALELDLVPF
jgi:glutathione S-transferase